MLENLIDDLEFSLKEKRLQSERLNQQSSNAAVSYLDHMTPEQLEMWQRGQNAYSNAGNGNGN